MALLLEKLPFFLLAAASGVVTFLVQQQAGAVSTLETMPLADRLENALVAYARYVGKLAWPSHLAVYYPHPHAWPWTSVLGSALLLVLISLGVLRQIRTRSFLAVGWFWFLGTMIPVIGLVQVGGQSMADRYSYIPSIGLFLAVVWGADQLLRVSPRRKLILGSGAALVLAMCAVQSRVQLSYWKDSETLFAHAIATTQESCVARYWLGNALLDGGDLPNGLANLERAAELDPSFPNVQGKLAYLDAGAGKFHEALEKYEQALKCRADFPEALNNLAWLLATCPDPGVRDGRRAVALAERACRLTGFQKTLYVGTLAAAYAEAGRFPEAVAAAERARANALAWGENGLAERNEQLLALYRAAQPYHEPAAPRQ